MISETDPNAGRIAKAVGDQWILVKSHIERVRTRRDRYTEPSIAYASADMELAYWIELGQLLQALMVGKTVQPS